MNDKKLSDIVIEVYRELYKNSEPKADFNEMMKTGETKKEGFFENYYLEQDRQQEIMDEVMSRYKLSKYEKHDISVNVNLGCSPNTSKEAWEKIRGKKT
jgi:hypothetical protein